MNSPRPTPDPRKTVFLLGVATVVAQALILREAMAAMGGSEMAWGTVMAIWLLGMALGSRVGAVAGTARVATSLPVVVLAAAGLGIVLFRAAPALVGTASGESLTTASAIWLWVAAVAPPAIAGGLGFPILAGLLGPSGGGRAYATEAFGSLTGGALLSVALVASGTTVALCLTVALVSAATVWRRSRVIATVLAAGMTAISPVAAEKLADAGWRWSGRPGLLSEWRETRLQRIEISGGFPINAYADGRLVASYPDPYLTMPWAHLMMLLHPQPAHVLAIGSAIDGSVEAMARHPVERLVVVEEDPELLQNLPSWYGEAFTSALESQHVQALITDPIRAVASPERWDLVVLHDGSPSTLRRNRTRTLEFLRDCRNNMESDGVLVMRVPVSDTYLGGAAGRLVAILASTLREVFPRLAVIPGAEVQLVAGGIDADLDLSPQRLGERLRQRNLADSELSPEMIPILVDRDRAATLSEAVAGEAAINTITHPRAVIPAIGLHEGRTSPGLLRWLPGLDGRSALPLAVVLAVACCGLLARSLIRRPPIAATAATVGFSSMGWWLLLLASWQATRGSVYSEVGALTAIFMAGIAAGAGFACRWTRPARRLPWILLGGSAASLLIAAGVAVRLPLIAVPLLLFAGGSLTGAAFPGLTALGRTKSRKAAAIAFAADEAGAAAGAAVIGIVAIPWAGFTATALGLSALLTAAVPATIVARRHSGRTRSPSPA